MWTIRVDPIRLVSFREGLIAPSHARSSQNIYYTENMLRYSTSTHAMAHESAGDLLRTKTGHVGAVLLAIYNLEVHHNGNDKLSSISKPNEVIAFFFFKI